MLLSKYAIELDWTRRDTGENRIVFEAVWARSTERIVKEVNRAGGMATLLTSTRLRTVWMRESTVQLSEG
jgi:hypothetical protein